MSEVLAGFTDTVHSAREKLPMLPYVERLESTDSLAAELTFLHSFLGYTHIWSDLSSSSPPNKSLIIEVVAATEGLERDVRDAFRIVDEDPDATLATELLNLGRRALGRRVGDLYEYRRSKLGQVLTSLEQKIELLKPKITAAYQDGSLSPQSFFHPQSPSPEARVGALRCWERFCDIVRWNLGYLSCEQKPVLGDALREQMKSLKLTLDSLSWIFITRQWPSPWENNMMALFGPMVVQAAHFCCLCWYNPPIDPTMVQDLAILISDLRCKMMDPDGPEFMDIGIGFLEGYAGQDLGRSIYSFICHILHFQYRSEAPEKELFSLLTCLPKISRLKSSDLLNLTSDIKDVLIQARYTGQNSKDGDKYAYFVLFARMWSLKAEIMVKCPGILPLLTWNDLVEALRDGCRYLEKSIQENEKPAEYHQILELIEGVSKQVRSLYQRSPGTEDYLVHFKVSNLLLNFLVHIVLLKSKALLVKLQEKDARLMLPLQHKVKTLYDELVFLLEFVVNATEKYSAEEERVFLTDVHLVAQEVISFCNTSLPENLTEEGAKNLDVWPIDISEKVQLLMPMLKGHFSQFSGFDFPKTPGMCFIQHLLENLRDLIKCKHESVAHASHHIEAICEDMEFIVSEFQDVFDEDAEKQKCGDVVTKLVHIAYQVEHVIALMFSENKSTWQHSFWLYCWSDEIRHIRKQLTDFDESNNCNDEIHSYPQRLMPVVSKFTESKIEEVMIGHNDQRKQIIARLTRGTKERDVVLISGMPGIGKTTLAGNVFRDQNVVHHFVIRAWCSISLTYNKRDLLLDILSQISPITDSTREKSKEDLAVMLYRKLKKRYLIVMDDMWSSGALDDLKLSFPNDLNGSRILLTSRLGDVVSDIKVPYHLPQLSKEESWKLLKLKIFQTEECPEDLLEVGQEIAESCGGLPLAIGAIAGILDRKCGKSQSLCKRIAESVSSHIINDPETQCKRILNLSFHHLPDHLKACLLYFGALPKGKDIPVWRLQCLWIAEGFIYKLESKSLEDRAKDYLMDLVGRSLIIVAKRRSDGRSLKACRVHDLVRDLCLLKAKDDRFLQLISDNDEPYHSFNALKFGAMYEHFKSSSSRSYEQYRLQFRVDQEQFAVSRPSGRRVRSLIFSAATDKTSRCSYDVSFIPNNFKLLKVLDLESINMGGSFGIGIELLLCLTYLAVCGDMESIPPSLSKLRNLETLIVKGFKRMVLLPDTIWKMKKLRHIHVSNHAVFALPKDDIGRSFQLDSLVTLSLPYFPLEEETNEIIVRLPNLRKLKCTISGPTEFSMNSSRIPSLESLCFLESLKISHFGRVSEIGELKLPLSLKRLTLSNFGLSPDQISATGRLPELQVLKVISCDFEGSSWEMTEGEFQKLEYLKLDTLDIVHWDASSDHLPELKQLIMRNCKHLEEIPSDFMYISTLEKIEVQQCGNLVEESVRKIEEQEIEGLKIFISNSYSA